MTFKTSLLITFKTSLLITFKTSSHDLQLLLLTPLPPKPHSSLPSKPPPHSSSHDLQLLLLTSLPSKPHSPLPSKPPPMTFSLLYEASSSSFTQSPHQLTHLHRCLTNREAPFKGCQLLLSDKLQFLLTPWPSSKSPLPMTFSLLHEASYEPLPLLKHSPLYSRR